MSQLPKPINKSAIGRLVSYRWALDTSGRPTPIETAQHGRQYTCPLCHTPMIPRLGEQIVHHFGHDHIIGCSPETVNRAVLRLWLKITLSEVLTTRQAVNVQWSCTKCSRVHQDNLLRETSRFIEDYQWREQLVDLALVDEAGKLCAVVVIRDSLSDDERRFFTNRDVFTLVIPPEAMPTRQDFVSLVEQSQVISGPCPILNSLPNLTRQPESIRQVLRDTVEAWPGYFFAGIETVQDVPNVVRVHDRLLWLPYPRWQEIIGGIQHRVATDLNVTIQTWLHSDGGPIWLYYVTMRNSSAIGIRRYSPGTVPTVEIDARYLYQHTTALDVARYLVQIHDK